MVCKYNVVTDILIKFTESGRRTNLVILNLDRAHLVPIFLILASLVLVYCRIL